MNLFCSYFCFDFIGHLCATINRAGGVHRKCTPMTKRYTPPYYIHFPKNLTTHMRMMWRTPDDMLH